MPTPQRRSFLRRLGHRWGRRQAPDLADMGTAFALDFALDQAALRPGSRGETAPRRASVPVASWRLWLGRKLGA